jgi:hypothetical protein
MAVVTWGDLLKVAHDFTLALRAIERILSDTRMQEILSKLPQPKLEIALQSVKEGNVPLLRQLLREQSVLAAEDLSLAALRQRASQLRIPHYNKYSRPELIAKITALELSIQALLQQKPIKLLCRDGFIHGDGI